MPLGALFHLAALILLLAGGAVQWSAAEADGAARPAAEAAAPGRQSAGPAADSLVILHTNDVHSHLDPFIAGPGRIRVGGAAQRAALIGREREGAAATLTLDAGDVFQGTAYFNFFAGVPDYRLMSVMGYDAAALGNHDLDNGPAAWLSAKVEARFPVLSANVFVAAESAWAAPLPDAPAAARAGAVWIGGTPVPGDARLKQLCEPYLVREAGGRRVALLGLTTKELVRIVSLRRNRGVAVSDPVTVAAKLVPELRRKADVVIVLSHLGLDEDRRLAARVPGIDVIVGGHSHTLLKAPLVVLNRENANGYHGTAIVQAGSKGEWLGRTTLRFTGERLAAVAGTVFRVDAGYDAPRDPRVAETLRPYTALIEDTMSVHVIRAPERYGTDGLRDGDTPLGNFVADALREAGRADVAIQNVGGIRASIPDGEVTVGDLYAVLPFDNRVVTVEMKGWQLRQLLDFIARRIGGGGFAQVSGVRFTVARDRASYIRVGGKPLDDNRTYRVATIDFLYDGGDGYTAFEKAGPARDAGVYQRDAAIEFLRRHGEYVFRDDGRIRWEGGTDALRNLRAR